jgi:hypothetical protein
MNTPQANMSQVSMGQEVTRLLDQTLMEKGIVVVLRLDAETEAKQRALHRELSARSGVDFMDYEPHITLAAYENPPLEEVLAWTETCAVRHAPFEVRFSSFGFFPSNEEASGRTVLHLAPAAAPALTALYYEVHTKLDEFCGELGWLYSMRYGHPAMHSTVHMLDAKSARAAAAYMLDEYSEIVGTAVAIEVHRWPMRLLARFPLGGGEL